MTKHLLWALSLLFCVEAFAQAEVAVVKMLRGDASMVTAQGTVKLAADQKVLLGSTVTTGEKSFVRLVFVDKSLMNIGPNSEMKIEQFGGGEAGVIGMVKGKLRSQVSKDYLQQQDQSKSKLLIKTSNAVMGVRGTDFQISTNGVSTNVVLFEGLVLFNHFENALAPTVQPLALEASLGAAGVVSMQPGEFSVQMEGAGQPTVPAVLNVQQLETMEKNMDFSAERGPNNQSDEASAKSIVPPGLSGAAVANAPAALKAEIAQRVSNVASSTERSSDARAAAGFEANGQVRPANGSFLHVDSGVVVAPPKDSVFDPNSNSFIPSAGAGKVGADGNYVPPKNVTITETGKVVLQLGGHAVVVEAPSASMGRGSTLGDVMKIAPANAAILAVNGGSISAAGLVAAAENRSGNGAVNPAAASAPIVLPPSVPKEAPTLCSTCGGVIPGAAATVNSSNVGGTTHVIVNPH